jgi:hypothetical protein
MWDLGCWVLGFEMVWNIYDAYTSHFDINVYIPYHRVLPHIDVASKRFYSIEQLIIEKGTRPSNAMLAA